MTENATIELRGGPMSEVTLREYLDNNLESLRDLIDERDRRYEERDAASKAAVGAAFRAAERISEKTEAALKEYKATANEWGSTFGKLIERTATKEDVDRRFDEIKAQVADLRESRSAARGSQGSDARAKVTQGWLIGIGVTVILGQAGLIVTILMR